jgi:hypothetical protein
MSVFHSRKQAAKPYSSMISAALVTSDKRALIAAEEPRWRCLKKVDDEGMYQHHNRLRRYLGYATARLIFPVRPVILLPSAQLPTPP